MQVRIRISRRARSGSQIGASSRVALGILLSRISGLLRDTVFAHYFGNSAVAGVWRAAYKIPNLLSNLFGEGVLSASFITVYAKLLGQDEKDEAEHVAEAVFGILAVVSAAIVLLGVLATPLLIELIAPGFKGADRALTVSVVRILFPGAGVLVLSAWCLGVLNSHRRFLLSYTAPVAMNAAMIFALFAFGGERAETLVLHLAWASVLGAVLQFLVQVPGVLHFLPAFRPVLAIGSENVRLIIRNFGPVFVSRGVVQVSSYIDQFISSYLGPVAVAALGYGQTIAVLPISLFSMSISAAELPNLSSATGTADERTSLLRSRITAGLRRIAFLIVPSAVAFLLLGDVISGALYRTGRFGYSDAVFVWSALAGSSVGLLASALGRLYSSGFYALLDTRTPLRFAVIRVSLTAILGYFFAIPLPRWLGIDPKWGVAGLTASAGIAGWCEFALLRRALSERIGAVALPRPYLAKLWGVAFASGLAGFAVKMALGTAYPRLLAAAVLSVYGVLYFAGTGVLGVEESQIVSRTLLNRLRR